jgi:hypothetical protein
MGTGQMRAEFWWGNPKEKNYLEDPGIDGRTIVNWIFKKWIWAWTGSILFIVRTGVRVLRNR